MKRRGLAGIAAILAVMGIWSTPVLAKPAGVWRVVPRAVLVRASGTRKAHARISAHTARGRHRRRHHASDHRRRRTRAANRRHVPVLSVRGATLHWTATARSHKYVEARITRHGTRYVHLVGISDHPPAVPGATVKYRVRSRHGHGGWSNEVSISYSTSSMLASKATAKSSKGQRKHEVAETHKREREAEEQAEREAEAQAEREAKEQAEREAANEVEPDISKAVVNAYPTGPPSPAGGWQVAFADAFGAKIGTGAGEDSQWIMPQGYEPAEQSNDLNVYNASQVKVGANGLELIAHHSPDVGGTGKNYVSGAIYTINHFTMRSYAGATFALECFCRWPKNGGAADPAFWQDGSEGGPEQEIDDFEGFGWNSDGSTEWGAGLPVLVHLGSHVVYHTEGVLKVFGFDPTEGFHRYTTVIGPGTSGNTRASEYIDGVFRWSLEVPTPSSSSGEHLILSYALREYPERVLPEDTTFAARSVAVYEDGAHAGQFVSGGGVAPGTIVQ